mmetsp:Transcript_49160/g.130139  ORF Transcript_49160/g.130139 Transcript_49160/m.130139 type:complete len:471 (-) Transcript_49160:128-1540(-)|eukprot:CAMPEP_0194525938 /NCGR_PEP_ID=MMETSP0253-20130528/61596_1 /TAXON_ID=2966 /ORGANISM="Noctiluca scintillans" /LENGTH=470 /DNA_ID=CAMNT_0039370719 /DNA_START=1 /DNA_END=1413 /DNA_ORIENTATION=+
MSYPNSAKVLAQVPTRNLSPSRVVHRQGVSLEVRPKSAFFDSIDVNHDGVITRAEFDAAMAPPSEPMVPPPKVVASAHILRSLASVQVPTYAPVQQVVQATVRAPGPVPSHGTLVGSSIGSSRAEQSGPVTLETLEELRLSILEEVHSLVQEVRTDTHRIYAELVNSFAEHKDHQLRSQEELRLHLRSSSAVQDQSSKSLLEQHNNLFQQFGRDLNSRGLDLQAVTSRLEALETEHRNHGSTIADLSHKAQTQLSAEGTAESVKEHVDVLVTPRVDTLMADTASLRGDLNRMHDAFLSHRDEVQNSLDMLSSRSAQQAGTDARGELQKQVAVLSELADGSRAQGEEMQSMRQDFEGIREAFKVVEQRVFGGREELSERLRAEMLLQGSRLQDEITRLDGQFADLRSSRASGNDRYLRVEKEITELNRSFEVFAQRIEQANVEIHKRAEATHNEVLNTQLRLARCEGGKTS